MKARRIYRLTPAEGFAFCEVQGSTKDDALDAIHAGLASKVPNFKVHLVDHDETGHLSAGDLPWLDSSVLVMTERSRQVLEAELRPFGFVVPLPCDEQPLSAFVTTVMSDALDLERSDLSRLDNGSVIGVWKHVFAPEALPDAGVFGLSCLGPFGGLCFGESVVATMRRQRLTGADFEEIWRG